MPTITRNFDRYRMSIYSGHPTQAAISLLNPDGTDMARVYFVRDGDALPANRLTGTTVLLNYPVSRLGDITAMLRYETPLYLHFNTDTRVGMISTLHAEVVGEQEL
jgi:hypothetical protein